jgi:sulfatase modifying factor 1
VPPIDRRRALVVAGTLVAAAGIVAWGAASTRTISRVCAPGMQAIGPRCCGEGQWLEGGRCVGAPSRCAAGLEPKREGCVAEPTTVELANAALKTDPEDWDTAGARHEDVFVAGFLIDAFEITEAAWSSCVDRDECPRVELRGEAGVPVANVSAFEAEAFCARTGGSLPSPHQFELASGGPEGERFPWGGAGAVCLRAAWGLEHGPCGEGGVSPDVVGAHPDGRTHDGIQDLAGNVAEWTTPRPDGMAEVRGGSYRDQTAAALKTWQPRLAHADQRFPDVGFRCVHAGRPAPAKE